MSTRLGAAVLAFAFVAAPATAQTVHADGMTDPALAAVPPAGHTVPTGGFELLSAGNRKIALALFDAQGAAAGNDVAWTLDEIAGAKRSGTSWTELFRRMRAEGLIDAASLGAVISGAVRKWNARPPAEGKANGAPAARRGSFKMLSREDRRIAEALFEDQSIGRKGRHAWSLDQIATARQNGMRWTKVLKRLRSDGLIRARTLGGVLSRHARPAAPATPPRKVVVTNGSGRHEVLTTRSSRRRSN